MKRRSVEILDTTLRDGAQAEGISFSVNAKFQVVEDARRSGGPLIMKPAIPARIRRTVNLTTGSGPIRRPWQAADWPAFASTRRKNSLAMRMRMCAIAGGRHAGDRLFFGKVWVLEVRDILRCSLKENQAIIRDTIAYLPQPGARVIIDAEHYFEACAANRDYALSC